MTAFVNDFPEQTRELISYDLHGSVWDSPVRTLIRSLVEINPNFQINQIKEKFGELRVYSYGMTKEQKEFLEQEIERINQICYKCGDKPKKMIYSYSKSQKGYYVPQCQDCIEAEFGKQNTEVGVGCIEGNTSLQSN